MANFSIDKALEILEQTPKTLTSFLQNLSDEWIFSNEGDETWSPFDVIGHLIHGEKTDWIQRLNKVLSENDKHFDPFDRFAQFESSKGKSLQQLLSEFEVLRTKNLVYFKSLNISETDLQKTGIHPDFGQVTLQQLLATWVTHDLGHIAQVARVMAKQYTHEVGHWTAYISILQK
ncbi:DinB family protein [Flavobacteriaceae bacterium S356]|uniref:DinB family protein n=1 Tax=Asprobacillus argus TaxID=3076534 RepID=A0ABU3LCK4_9FLAO|nr:DinB family protein [Flavobacteriaceae bacterium S356]